MSNGTGIARLPAVGARRFSAPAGGGLRFGGYASLFGVADLGRDMVEPGAFAAALSRRGAAGIRLLFQHDPAEPVGRWTTIREDRNGLYVEGWLTPGVQKAEELAALIGAGALDGLSIGFRTVRARNDARNAVRRIIEADLWEVSIVTFPMLPGARLRALPDDGLAPAAIEAEAGRLAALRLAAGLRSATRQLHGKERAV